jgi:hypothetical protein
MPRPTRAMLIAGIAVVLAAGIGGAVTYALTSHDTSVSAAAPAPAETGTGKAAKHAKGAKAAKGAKGAEAGLIAKVDHGEFTGASGVMDVQRGAVTAVDPGSLTVRSTDGFTATYVLDPSTRIGAAGPATAAAAGGATPAPAPLKAGDTVRVLATKTGDTATATRVTTVAAG